MSTTLAIKDQPKVLAKTQSFLTQEEISLIKNLVAKDATDAELKLFLYVAERTKLNPLLKQIHFVKRAGQMTVQTGIDGYRAVAERSGTLAGIDDAIFDDETGITPGKASVTVYRIISDTRVSFTASARWNEYAPQGGQAFMWKKMPFLMLSKCAEALALRKAFPNDLAGIYTNEEMEQSDKTPNVVTSVPPTPHQSQDLPPSSPVIEGKVEVPQDVVDALTKEPQKPTSEPQKHCPFCGCWHDGAYVKCLSCWKDEKNGRVLSKTKVLVNEDAEPFQS